MTSHLRRAFVAAAALAAVGAVAPAANAATITATAGSASVTLNNITDAPVGINDYFLIGQSPAGNIAFSGVGPTTLQIVSGPQPAGCGTSGPGTTVSPSAVPTTAGTYHLRVLDNNGIHCFGLNFDVRTSTTSTTTVVGNVAPVLTLTPTNVGTTTLTNSGFGAFRPNTSAANEDYSGSLSLTIVSTADQAYLTAEDAGSPVGNARRGFLVNNNVTGPYTLNTPLKISSTSVDPTITGTVTDASMQSDPPVQIASINDPVTNKSVGVSFKQSIVPNEPIRTGQYAMPVLFTLSTSTP